MSGCVLAFACNVTLKVYNSKYLNQPLPGRPVRKRAREHWLASVILHDFQDEVESLDLPD